VSVRSRVFATVYDPLMKPAERGDVDRVVPTEPEELRVLEVRPSPPIILPFRLGTTVAA
jgi:hypothetical protein